MRHLFLRSSAPRRALLALALLASGLTAQDEVRFASPQELVGTWVFSADRSPASSKAPRRPNQGARFTMKLEGEALLLLQPRENGEPHVVRIALDGTPTTKEERGTTSTYAGRMLDGALATDVRIDAPGRGGKREITVSKFTYAKSADGLLVSMKILEPVQIESVCLYVRLEDIPRPTPAAATLEQLAWLAGAWTGTMGRASIEERWSPSGGGAMLAISRTVSNQRMVAFEYLRIVERDGGLVYIAQPNGRAANEFVLTAIDAQRAVFENPLHDFPQRIEYARQGETGLKATISDRNGSQAQSFEFVREAQ